MNASQHSQNRVNMELKRRTRVAGIFPNEASLLRLVSARLEICPKVVDEGL